MTATIACPFCQTTCPLVGGEPQPFPLTEFGDFPVYTCLGCGAVGSPSGEDLWEAGSRLDRVETALASILACDRAKARIELNYVMYSNPPMLMLWAKRREV